MPAEFQFPYRGSGVDLWIPWELPAVVRGRLEAVVARLRPGVGLEAARQELSAMASPSAAAAVWSRCAAVKDVVIAATTRSSLLVLLGAVGMVLLVACVNVANLLLARTAAPGPGDRDSCRTRRGTHAHRPPVPHRESPAAGAGAVAGLALGVWGSRALVRAAASQLPRAGEIGLDWRVFGFSSRSA